MICQILYRRNCHDRHDVMIHTSLLLDGLEISRSQFLRIRQVLVEWGFLAIRPNSRQQTFYTLLLEGRQVALAAAAPQKDARPSAPEPAVQEERQQPSAAPSTTAPAETNCSSVPAQPSSPMASRPTHSPAASTFSISGEAFSGGDVILN